MAVNGGVLAGIAAAQARAAAAIADRIQEAQARVHTSPLIIPQHFPKRWPSDHISVTGLVQVLWDLGWWDHDVPQKEVERRLDAELAIRRLGGFRDAKGRYRDAQGRFAKAPPLLYTDSNPLANLPATDRLSPDYPHFGGVTGP